MGCRAGEGYLPYARGTVSSTWELQGKRRDDVPPQLPDPGKPAGRPASEAPSPLQAVRKHRPRKQIKGRTRAAAQTLLRCLDPPAFNTQAQNTSALRVAQLCISSRGSNSDHRSALLAWMVWAYPGPALTNVAATSHVGLLSAWHRAGANSDVLSMQNTLSISKIS